MKEPTKVQTVEFWKRYGIEYGEQYQSSGDYTKSGYYLLDIGGATIWFAELPPINLINLFQYAIDWNEVETIQFSKGDDGCHCWIYTKKPTGRPFHGNGLTEGDALFWALWEVKEKSNAK